MATIRTSVEAQRGCGYRKPGGLYLVSGKLSAPCGRLPHPLTVCPTCSCGVKPARSWTWVDAAALFKATPCEASPLVCGGCPLSDAMLANAGRAGLLWIGEKFYPTAAEFMLEAARMGVSRRIPAVPRDFEPGKTWVLMAHRKAILSADGEECTPGIVTMFRPDAVEYIVQGDETEEQLDALEKRGLALVKVEHEQLELAAPRESSEPKHLPVVL